MRRRTLRPLGILGIAGLALYFVVAGLRGVGAVPTSQTFNAIPVLQKVQSLGELRSARFTYRDVFEYQTHREPEAWVRYMPGGTSLVRATTRNSALMSVTGEVEAGVDLRLAEVSPESNEKKIILVIPQPKIYKPQVTARIHNMKIGMFWSDHNLGLKAQEDAQLRLKRAAMQQGIIESAKDSAVEVLSGLLGQMSDAELEVQFEG